MKAMEKKTVRFDALVKSAGRPEQVTLWTKPEDDRGFSRAVKENRVVTVIQSNVGTKKDYGLIGFFPQEKAAYLLFPKKLPNAVESKVIGIKYGELAPSEPKGELFKPKARRPIGIPLKPRSAKNATQRSDGAALEVEQPKVYRYRAKVETKAVHSAVVEVEARSEKEASRLIKQQTQQRLIDLKEAKVTHKMSAPRRIRS